jgi:arylformamidase
MIALETLASELFKNYRIIDLSVEIHPGVEKVDGHYHWGNQLRKFEIRQFIAPGPHFMYWVETETHVGTHVELPAHIIEGAKSATEIPLETFIGQCIVLKFDSLKPEEGERQLITPAHLKNVKAGDIVLMWSPYNRNVPLISTEAAEMLAEMPIKMLGIQGVAAGHDTHEALLGKEDAPIPIIEELDHLDEVKKERVFFIGLPLRVAELDSSWIRAVAFEPLG